MIHSAPIPEYRSTTFLCVDQPIGFRLRICPAALIDNPSRIHPVVECDHRSHAPRADVSYHVVVVGEFGLVPAPGGGLNSRPLDAESENLRSQIGRPVDVLGVAMTEVDRVTDLVVGSSGIGVSRPVAVRRRTFRLESGGGNAPEEVIRYLSRGVSGKGQRPEQARQCHQRRRDRP